MKSKIIDIIEKEDKRNPFIDEEIACMLQTFRENITRLRNELQIPASSERRKERLLWDIQSILRKKGTLSDRKLTEILNQKGYEIGKYTVGQLRKENPDLWELESQIEQEEDISKKNARKTQTDELFSKFIGFDGSLKNQISKAKAAVIYPPKGLHTLIYGPSGVGKSFLAELMYHYAVQTENFKEGAPYFEFNCADYADNPQLLLAQLFGYTKGAFTGAVEHKKGIVELCDGGILFLDEIHRLPAEGQEILFYLIDKGRFRRLGEADTSRESHPLIIAATTEDPESSLLLTFRRRIPMNIEIPSLQERPLEEKRQFIELYFTLERSRLGRDIKVAQDVFSCLLDSEFPGNVGQLKSDIQVCCAKAFLEACVSNRQDIEVMPDNLPEHLKANRNQIVSKEIRSLLQGDVLFSERGSRQFSKYFDQLGGTGIYEHLENKYAVLIDSGISREEISRLLQEEVEETLTKQIRSMEESKFSLHELSNIVGKEVLDITEAVYQEAKKTLPGLRDSIIFPLAIHIRSSLEVKKERREILGSSLDDMKKRHAAEYRVAADLLKKINKKFYVQLADEEAVFFAMYFSKFQSEQMNMTGRTAVLLLSHGRVAGGMAEIANRILGVNHAAAIEMALSEDPAVMYEKTKKAVLELEQGRGCIILADMGSLLTFGEKIKKETGIPVAVVGRVDTLMVIECLHKVLWTEEPLETIARGIDCKLSLQQRNSKENVVIREKAILCLCITGLGAAKELEDFISQRLNSVISDIKIITRGYIENERTEQIIAQVAEKYELLAVVGTINPEMNDYPFISAAEIYQSKGISRLRRMIKERRLMENVILGEVIPEELIFVKTGLQLKEQILDQAVETMTKHGYVEDKFLLSIYKREGLMTTYLKGGIAIPHGDPSFVTKPVISITKLDKPILWDGTNTVDIIFLLALKEDSKKYFEQLYQMISNETLITSIRNSNSIKEIRENLHLDTKPVN